MSTEPLTVSAVRGIGEICDGDDLAAVLAPLLPTGANSRTVLVVAQKIVSKAEGRRVFLDSVEPSPRARELAAATGKHPALVELVLQESSAVLRVRPNVLIVRHRLGFVMANAGIDQSNVPGADGRPACLLLPLDPNASARRLREGLHARLGYTPGVIVSDSFGRAWRRGVVNVALGSAGITALSDQRGRTDREGRTLQVTEVANADALAAAAGLVMGEAAQGTPVVVIRGGDWSAPDIPATRLLRPLAEDLFQ